MNSAPLAELCEIYSGGTPSRTIADNFGGTIPWAKISDIEAAAGGELIVTEETITARGLQEIRGRLFPAGTLLFAIYGSVGKMAFAGRELSANQAILGIQITDRARLDRQFLHRWLEAQRNKFDLEAQGIAQKNLSAGYVRSLHVPLPPLDEQRRIAAILDAADALRAKRRAALAKLDALAQSIFIEMFAGEEARGWPLIRIDDLKDADSGGIRTGPFGSQLLHSEFVESGIAVLGIDNAVTNRFQWGQRRYISEQKYRELARYTVRPGDVIITIMGTCGRCAIIPHDIPKAINTKHLCCITLDQARCLPVFLHRYFLTHPEALAYLGLRAKGAIMDGLNMGIIREMPVRLPPIELQQRFAERSAALDRWAEDHRRASQTAENLFQALQHRAFQGEL